MGRGTRFASGNQVPQIRIIFSLLEATITWQANQSLLTTKQTNQSPCNDPSETGFLADRVSMCVVERKGALMSLENLTSVASNQKTSMKIPTYHSR